MTTTEPTSSEFLRTQRSDHDTLVRLETIMEQVAKDIKDFTVNIAMHDTRLRALEKVMEQYPAAPLVAELKADTEWIRDFKTTYRVVMLMASFAGAFIMFLFGIAVKFVGFIK